MLRLFIALEMEQALHAGIEALVSNIKRIGLDARWVPVQNIHLTLKFLGDTDEKQIEPVNRILDECAQDTASFEITLREAGVFPNVRSPHVLWLGCHDSAGSITRLHDLLETKLAALGFPAEGRRFSPHLTLARIKSPKNSEKLKNFLAENQGRLVVGRSRVEGITLFKSDLSPAGAVYTPLYNAGMKKEPRIR